MPGAKSGSLNNDPSTPLLRPAAADAPSSSGETQVPSNVHQLSNDEIRSLYADDDSNGFDRNALASPLTAVFNLANAAIGAGVLAFPYAYSLMGWGFGVIVTGVAMLVMIRTQFILGKATALTRSSNYSEMMNRSLGPKWGLAGTLVLSVYLIGALIAYVKVIGDQVGPVASHFFGKDNVLVQPYLIIPIFAVVFVLPLAFLPRVDILAPASYIAVLACGYVCVFIWVDGIMNLEHHHAAKVPAFHMTPDLFAAIPLITFAFTGHAIVPTIFAAIKGHDMKTFRWAAVLGTCLCALLYVPTGLLGYETFGKTTQGDILLNFGANNVMADVGRVAMAVTVIMAYPINGLPVRASLSKLLFPKSDFKPFGLHYSVFTVVMWLLCVGCAIAAPGLQTIFGLIGATLGVCLVFLFPAVLNVRFAEPGSKQWAFVESAFIVLIGLFVAGAGGTLTILGAIKAK